MQRDRANLHNNILVHSLPHQSFSTRLRDFGTLARGRPLSLLSNRTNLGSQLLPCRLTASPVCNRGFLDWPQSCGLPLGPRDRPVGGRVGGGARRRSWASTARRRRRAFVEGGILGSSSERHAVATGPWQVDCRGVAGLSMHCWRKSKAHAVFGRHLHESLPGGISPHHEFGVEPPVRPRMSAEFSTGIAKLWRGCLVSSREV